MVFCAGLIHVARRAARARAAAAVSRSSAGGPGGGVGGRRRGEGGGGGGGRGRRVGGEGFWAQIGAPGTVIVSLTVL